jgi:preprotein translocase subunit YajC
MNLAANFALWAAAPTMGQGSSLPLLLLPLFFVLMFFMMIRPQQKRQKQWQKMLADIKSGDKVTTAGGIRGTIISIKDDAVIVRVAPDNLKLEIAKNAIASVTTQDSSSGS